MSHENKAMLIRMRRAAKLVFFCFCPAIILKIWQRIRKYKPYIIHEINSPVKMPLLKRLWAMKHGFYSDRILFYGLKKETVHRYMPDHIHESLHPVNKRFSAMIDDKLQLPFLLKDFPEHVPNYHYLIYDSEMIDLSRSGRNAVAYDPGKLLSFLKMNDKLIIKPLSETGGEGVLRIEANHGAFNINGNKYSDADAFQRLAKLEDYIVCEFAEQHHYADDLYPASTNTIRFITMRDYESHETFIGACFHRIGTNRSIPVDNFNKGGLLCSIDMESGAIGRALSWQANGGVQSSDRHPDTGVLLSGKVIPAWDHLKTKVLRMADRLAFLPYMGWDIVITNDGFKVLEINSLPTLLWQTFNPLCDNPRASEFYRQVIRKKGMKARSKCFGYLRNVKDV